MVIENTQHVTNDEWAALVEIGRALSTPDALHDPQTVYQAIYEQTRRIMPVDALFVSRYNQARRVMTMEYLIDEGAVYPPSDYKFIPAWIEGLLTREQPAYLFSTAEEYADFTEDYLEDDDDLIGNQHPSESLLFVPLFYGDELIGILSAQSYQRSAYTPRHLELLKEIGVQAGIALTNARLYTELREALKQAQKSEQLTNHFLMTASHELRTPLTSIQGYLELLSTYDATLDEDMRRRFITNANRACEELVLLLGNVMDTSRVDQDRVMLNMELVQVSHAIQRIVEILEPMLAAEKRPIEVVTEESLYVCVDDLRLRQILLNLVGNALKYTPETAKIAITAACIHTHTLNQRLLAVGQLPLASQSEAFVLISVRDWGPGIAKEDIPRLFTKFLRLESAMNSVQRGAGLGLYLCRELTEAMDGRIWAESQGIEGEGSTFFVALPQSSSY